MHRMAIILMALAITLSGLGGFMMSFAHWMTMPGCQDGVCAASGGMNMPMTECIDHCLRSAAGETGSAIPVQVFVAMAVIIFFHLLPGHVGRFSSALQRFSGDFEKFLLKRRLATVILRN